MNEVFVRLVDLVRRLAIAEESGDQEAAEKIHAELCARAAEARSPLERAERRG